MATEQNHSFRHDAELRLARFGARRYRNGATLDDLAANSDPVRQGWIDEQRQTWSIEWPSDEGHYWAWVLWNGETAWKLRLCRVTRGANGLAYAMGGYIYSPKDFTSAMFTPWIPPPPAPLPLGAKTMAGVA